MSHLPLNFYVCVAEHEGSRRSKLVRAPITLGASTTVQAAGASWEFSLNASPAGDAAQDISLMARIVAGDASEAAFGLEYEDTGWSRDNYVLYPGAVYQGNRFYAKHFPYSPPPNGPRLGDADQTLHVGDVPRLSLEGASHLELLSNDCAVPGMGVYFPQYGRALLLLTDAGNALGPYGLELDESADQKTATIRIMAPGILHELRHGLGGYSNLSDDRGAAFAEGSRSELTVRWHDFICENVQSLYDRLFQHRQDCFELPPLKNEIPFSATWDILHRKHNQTNWIEAWGLYQTSISNDPPPPFNIFQTGWCGGGITTLPMLQEGDARSVQRALRNLGLLFSGQTDFGLFQEYFDGSEWLGIHGKPYCSEARPWTLTRRIGDALYFLTRQLAVLRQAGAVDQIKPEWESGLRRNVAAIRHIWETNGTIGQYVNVHTGAVEVSASTSGALIPAGLVLAADYFEEPEWIALAEAIGDDYRTKDLAIGVTSGGPGDCLQAPDSESIAALVESFALLHDVTGAPKWRQATRDAITQLASWAYAYDCEFPAGSALAEIGAQSRGAYIANVQNRCGVPGICTLSGEGMLRAFRATGDWTLLEFLREVSHTIPQYMGRADKPIPTRTQWGRKGITHLPEGWICERVNVGRWGAEMRGEIAAYSCWCETAMMLVWNDLPGVYWDLDTDRIVCIDHMEASVVILPTGEKALKIENPTRFDARVKVLAETAVQRQTPLPVNAGANYPVITVPSGGEANFNLQMEDPLCESLPQ